MDVQWMIIAHQAEIDEANRLSIYGIFDQITPNTLPYRQTIMILAKIAEAPLEIGQTKRVTLRVSHENHPNAGTRAHVDYKVLDLVSQADSSPYINYNLVDFIFDEEGEYRFEMLVDNQVKASDHLMVRLEGG